MPFQLLVSARRVAVELAIPAWKANDLCASLERFFYAPGQSHFRVSRRSLDAFTGLLEAGVTFYNAKSVMWEYKRLDELPPADISLEEVQDIVDRQTARMRESRLGWSNTAAWGYPVGDRPNAFHRRRVRRS